MTPMEPSATLQTFDAPLVALVQSFASENPCGEDPRLNPEFVELREQVTAQERPNTPATNWNTVETKAEELLAEHCKDLRLAVFLAVSYFQRSELDGFSKGARLLYLLLKEHQLALHPHARSGQEKGKIRALEWYLDYMHRHLNQRRGTENDAARVDFAIARLDELSAHATKLLSMDPAKFSSVLLAIQQLRRHNPGKSNAATKPAKASQAEQGPSSSSRTQSPASPPTALSWQTALDALRGQAHALREADPTQALSYRLLRCALWTPIHEAPPSDSAGQAQVPLPTEQERTQLQELEKKGQWRGLLEQAENLLGNYVLCLDLQAYAVAALKGIGNTELAIQSIESALVALLLRMPELLSLRGANSQPLASPQTRLWIEQELLAGVHPAPTSSQTQDLGAQPWWEAIATLSRDDVTGQLEKLQLGLDQSEDRLTYAQRALFAARHLPQIEGLAPLLGALAQKALRAPSSTPLCKATERACWGLVRAGCARAFSDATIELAQVDLKAALTEGFRA